jgi:hypothetical protein
MVCVRSGVYDGADSLDSTFVIVIVKSDIAESRCRRPEVEQRIYQLGNASGRNQFAVASQRPVGKLVIVCTVSFADEGKRAGKDQSMLVFRSQQALAALR